MYLGNLLTSVSKKYQKVPAKGICFDSRKAKKNQIFFAIEGNKVSGSKFIKDAIKKGSKIIISDNVKEEIKNNIVYIRNKNPRKLLAKLATKIFYKRPNNMVAVTGTNGKSSIANFYYQILKLNKKKVASIGKLCIKTHRKNF